MKSKLFTKIPDQPKFPAVILINPKFSRNVSGVLRAANCFGIEQVVFTGDRVHQDLDGFSRLPREERMKAYKKVDLFFHDKPFDFFKGVTPVGVELTKGTECLSSFEHPDNALYIFGPEDASIPQVLKKHCHRFVSIPSRHCLNLAAAAYVVFYDRVVKQGWQGNMLLEERGFIESLDELG